jgi:putative FmdB family regulatory protein
MEEAAEAGLNPKSETLDRKLPPMPLYEYNCLDCNDTFELLIRTGDQPHCPDCEGTRLEKLLSAPAAHIGGHELPICQPLPAGGCGLPQCGQGGCMMED